MLKYACTETETAALAHFDCNDGGEIRENC